LGDRHLRVVTVRGFPTSTWPGLLDELNRLAFPYRWVTRFLLLDKADAERELIRLRRQWFAKRKNIVALLRETVFQQESPLVDSDADNKAADADAALQELGADAVAYGYVTATVIVIDTTAAAADEKRKAIERVIQGRGFVTITETFNAVEAWLSSIPGHLYANVRQPLISTLNLAHLMPISAVWAGPHRNAHLNAPPLMVTRTAGSTPFLQLDGTRSTRRPRFAAIFDQSVAKCPVSNASTRSPGLRVLTSAASHAPVPEAGKMITGFSVWKTAFMPSRHDLANSAKPAPRWSIVGLSMARRTRSGTLVGPGI